MLRREDAFCSGRQEQGVRYVMSDFLPKIVKECPPDSTLVSDTEADTDPLDGSVDGDEITNKVFAAVGNTVGAAVVNTDLEGANPKIGSVWWMARARMQLCSKCIIPLVAVDTAYAFCIMRWDTTAETRFGLRMEAPA